MTAMSPLSGACVWSGSEVAKSSRWIKPFSTTVLEQIDVALSKSVGINWKEINKENFPLSGSESYFAEVREELETGTGMVKMTGLEVGRYSDEQLRQIWYALGHHLGTIMFQNYSGEVLREIRDESKGARDASYGKLVDESGKVYLSSGARTRSSGLLRFHTDRCDVVGLLCVRQASEGGVSKLVSSATIYNEILKRRPDFHALLCQPMPRSRAGEDAGGASVTYDLPVFGVCDGKSTSHFSLTYIENAQLQAGVRKLSEAEHNALQMLLAVAEEQCFEMRLAPGDIQLLNNHVIYHGRTAFKDDASSGQDRHLIRLWLSVPNSRALPDDHAVLWGNVEAGKPHGGIAQAEAAA